ncbi:MAG: TonB-dependent receptor [Bacteroidota bacterium]
MNYRFLFIWLCFPFTVQAQVALKFVDSKTGLPVEGVQVNFIKDSAKKFFALSDKQGLVTTTLEIPLKVQSSHISYNAQEILIQESTKTIRLTPSVTALKEIVITGQYAPQSARSSVYKVRTIQADRIEKQGANTLQEILANELNIRFGRDNALGTSGLSVQGISGQNVKVLIDGVPMVGRSGVANEIDIGQINVNSIDRVEIVEGPMAVNFGADALAGVINIITKKGGSEKFVANLTLQEETVENDYSLFEEGIHNAGLSLGSQLSERFYISAEGRINKFGGWVGDETQFDDRNRQWYPKDQYFGGMLVRYSDDNFSMHYRMDYLDQTISNLGRINDLDPDSEPFSPDQDFLTQRWMHQLQAEWQLGNWLLNPVISYTDYERLTENYVTFVVSDLETNRTQAQNTFYNTFFFRNTASINSLNWGSAQFGLETTFDKGAGSTLSEGNKYMEDIALFASAEITVNDKLTLRPGVRYSYNSTFETTPTPSLNAKYDFNTATQLRFGYGRGFRVPSLRELYHYFVDANHNIIGNPDLEPEYSHNVNLDLTHHLDKVNLKLSLSGFYNQIDDRIGFFTPEQSNAATTYLNISKFKSTGAILNATWEYKGLRLSPGATYIGRFQRLSENETDVPDFIFNWEVNTALSYQIKKTNTTISAFYKYNGPLEDYRMVDPDEDGVFTPELQGIEGFSLLDLSVNQSISDDLQLTLGARNLFDITAVDNNFTSGGAHGSQTGSTSVGYGTSYFIRLNYQFKIK